MRHLRIPGTIIPPPWKRAFTVVLSIVLFIFLGYLPLLISLHDVRFPTSAIDGSDLLAAEIQSSMMTQIQKCIGRFYTGLSDEDEAKLAEVIHRESFRYGYDPRFVLALIIVESSFYNRAVSSKGAKGLMQLRPFVARSLAEEMGLVWEEGAIYDPEINVRIGLYYLSKLMARFQDVHVALVAYNFGPTYIERQIEQGHPVPKGYADRVMISYRTLSGSRELPVYLVL